MKILFVNTHLSTGGIATSLMNLCNQLGEHTDLQIDVLLLNEGLGDTRYSLPKQVNILTSDSRWQMLANKSFKEIINGCCIKDIVQGCCIKAARKIIGPRKAMSFIMKHTPMKKGYDVAISFRNDEYQHRPYAITGCNDFVLNCTDATYKIAWIHNDPDRHGFTYDVAKEVFKDFDYIVNVSQGCKDRFDEIIPEYSSKSKLVYNTFNYDEIIEKSKKFNPYKESEIIKLVTVGRVENNQKCMNRIVEVCKGLEVQNVTNYEWHIVGDGPDLPTLKQEVEQYGLQGKIIFEGKQSNPFPYMKYADCLVMTSKYEAFPMTLNEALISRVPVITTRHISAKEIVKEGVNGLIAENSAEGIAKQVKAILTDTQLLAQLQDNVKNEKRDKELALNQFKELVGLKSLKEKM